MKDSLVLLDLCVAYTLGAPMGHTLSSNAWRIAQQGNPLGMLLVGVIDTGALAFGQKWHCHQAYCNAQQRIRKYGPH